MRKGFTLIETVMATSLMSLIIVAAMGSWMLFLLKSNRVNNQAMLDMDARKVVERFRHEVRNAARETIIFFPKNTEPYQAMGFALAEDSDGDGLMDMDASGSNILWRQTVIYHVWEKSDPPQMRRTLFENRNSTAKYDDYYQQISTVHDLGSGESACLTGERASTEIMFRNLFSGKLWHDESIFDGYAPEPNTLERETFGSISLEKGEHTLTLTIDGKHPKSVGYNLRLDQMSIGVSGWPLEAECRTVSSATTTPVFIGPNQAGAAYGLQVNTSGDGDKVSFTMYNDAIEEAEFIGKGRNVYMSNTVVRFDAEFTPSGSDQGAYVTKLGGQFEQMWQGGIQSGDGQRSEYYAPTNCIIRIPVMAPWVVADGCGPVFRLYKSLHNGALDIRNPVFAVVPTPENIFQPPPMNVDPDDNIALKFHQDGTPQVSWAACANQSYVELRPAELIKIDSHSTLMLTFEVRITNYGGPEPRSYPLQQPPGDCFTVFDNKRPLIPGCWMMIPKAGADNQAYDLSSSNLSNNYEIVELNKLPLLEMIAVNFADKGEYISNVYDSRSNMSAAKKIEWVADIPAGSDLTVYARSGDWISDDGFDITDAPLWENVDPVSNGGVFGNRRYMQFRVEMAAQPSSIFPGLGDGAGEGPYRSATPRLQHVLIQWDGEEKYVDIMANVLKSPDCGMFKVDVDNQPLIRGVNMEIEIFKDIRTMGGRKERLKSSMMAEVEPRNSNKK